MANAETIENDFDGMAEIDGDVGVYKAITEKEFVPAVPDPIPEPSPSGYIGSKDEWVAMGKNPEDWVSPEVFKERTLRIKNEQRLKRELAQKDKEFESRLKDVNLVQQAQLARQRAELLERRDEAIDVADRKTVNKLDKEIADLDKEADLVADKPVQSVAKPPEIVEWEEENPWIEDVNDPRTAVAQKAFAEAVAAGKTNAYALRAAEKAANSLKTEDKTTEIKKKPAVSMADSSRSAASGGDSLTLSWGQLTSEDKAIYDELFSHKSQKEYLKIVADARTGAKK